MSDDELNALVDLIRLHTAASRLNWRETADMIRLIEAKGYTVSKAPVHG